MIIRTYGSIYKKLSLLIPYKGTTKRIDFTGSLRNGGLYTTSDNKEMKAIEAHRKYYSKEIFIYSEDVVIGEDNVVVEKVVEVPVKEVEPKVYYVKRINDVVDILVESYGHKSTDVNTKAKIKVLEQKYNIKFIFE